MSQNAMAFAPMELKADDGDADQVDIVNKAIEGLRENAERRFAAIEAKANDNAKLTDRLDKFEARLNRPNAANDNADPKVEEKAFAAYLRGGDKQLSADEQKTLVVANDGAAGYLASPEFTTEMLKGLVQMSPVRQAVSARGTSSGSVIIPKRTGTPTGQWVGETETRPATGSAYGQLEIEIHECACYVDVSRKLLEDSAINVNAEVSSDLAEEFGRLEGVALLNGDGVKKPLGLMKATGVTIVNTGNAATLGATPADKLIDFIYSLPAFYRRNAAWMMNGNTLAVIRKLKDGNGNFLWQPAYTAGQPATILGFSVIEAFDMPDIGAGTEPIVFGDFATAYRIYDRVALNTFVDPYTQAVNGIIRIHARRRLGGGMRMAEAMRKLKCAV